jgi:hypothetical protein
MRSRASAVRMALLFASAVLLFGAATPARASVVLLDEYWSPEIMVNDVQMSEVDTEATGDPREAVAGCFSAKLENQKGWPSVRFRNAAGMGSTGLLPGQTEARLWYRTDKWNGKWTMEIWILSAAAGRPVQVLTADLDGGGEGGRLIADDRWHQARGMLKEGPEFGKVPAVKANEACYVWLRPTEGWDIAHTTYVDRIEVINVDGPRKGEAPPAPASRVRPSPGAQTMAPGLVMWEGEDAVESTFPPDGLYVPETADQQRLLSNGAWLQHLSAEGAKASWKVTVPDAGPYALWARGFWYKGSFRWRIDEGEWQMSGPDRKVTAAVKYCDSDAEAWGIAALMVGWTPLGSADLKAGEHTLQIECLEDATGFGFDCFVLAHSAFSPPAEQAGAEE